MVGPVMALRRSVAPVSRTCSRPKPVRRRGRAMRAMVARPGVNPGFRSFHDCFCHAHFHHCHTPRRCRCRQPRGRAHAGARRAGHGRGRLCHRHRRIRHHGPAARGGARPGGEHSAGRARDQRLRAGRGGGRAGAGRAGGALGPAGAAHGADGGLRPGQLCVGAGARLCVAGAAAAGQRPAARHLLRRRGAGRRGTVTAGPWAG